SATSCASPVNDHIGLCAGRAQAIRCLSTTILGQPLWISMWLIASPAWPPPIINVSINSVCMEASIALFHCHAGECESGGKVLRRQWACPNFGQGDLVRDWSKPSEALLGERDFRRCHLFIHFPLLL